MALRAGFSAGQALEQRYDAVQRGTQPQPADFAEHPPAGLTGVERTARFQARFDKLFEAATNAAAAEAEKVGMQRQASLDNVSKSYSAPPTAEANAAVAQAMHDELLTKLHNAAVEHDAAPIKTPEEAAVHLARTAELTRVLTEATQHLASKQAVTAERIASITATNAMLKKANARATFVTDLHMQIQSAPRHKLQLCLLIDGSEVMVPSVDTLHGALASAIAAVAPPQDHDVVVACVIYAKGQEPWCCAFGAVSDALNCVAG
jgi:hypothetical protein